MAKNSQEGFQVIFTSRMQMSTVKVGEVYYSNGGELNLITNTITTDNGGLKEKDAVIMAMKTSLLIEQDVSSLNVKVSNSANTRGRPIDFGS